jgi:hypothetical protein
MVPKNSVATAHTPECRLIIKPLLYVQKVLLNLGFHCGSLLIITIILGIYTCGSGRRCRRFGDTYFLYGKYHILGYNAVQVCLMLTDVSEKHIASIFTVEE